MPATTQSAPALVAGAQTQEQATVKVRLLRAICIGGKPVAPGELEVDRSLAAMLIGARKAERIEPAASEAAPPAPAEEPQPRGRRGRSQE